MSAQTFAAKLAALGDVVVSDGFGVVHRKQASVYELAQQLPSAAGLLIAAELDVLDRLTENPEKPYTVVLGGSKVSDKLGVIGHLLPRVDSLLIGGGMLFTFLAALGHKVGSSLLEADQLDVVRGYLAEAERLGVEIVLPTDVVVASKFGADAEVAVTRRRRDRGHRRSAPPASDSTSDRRPRPASRSVIASSKTVFWNGPMGVFELAPFAAGTKAVAEALTEVDGLGVVGRRRFGGRHPSARIHRRPVRPRLDRRRCQPRVPRGQEAPRTGGPRMAAVTLRRRGAPRSSRATGR